MNNEQNICPSDNLKQVVLENLVQYRWLILREEEEAIVVKNKLLVIDFHLNSVSFHRNKFNFLISNESHHSNTIILSFLDEDSK